MTRKPVRRPRVLLIVLCMLVGVVVGGLLFFVALNAAGGGHGTYLPAILFFPYAMAIAVPVGSIAIPLVMLAIVQFPAYGVVIGATWQSRQRSTVWLTVGSVHVAAAAIAGILAKTVGDF